MAVRNPKNQHLEIADEVQQKVVGFRRANPQHFKISVVIPCLNEARGLRRVLPAIPDIVEEVLIVDGGSSDDTIAVAAEILPSAIILRQKGRGKGSALKEGTVCASSGSIVITMDGDGSMDPGDIRVAAEALLAGADFVKGSRVLPGGGSSDFTLIRKVGNSALTENC